MMLASRPEATTARELLRRFDPVGYLYASLATAGDERQVRWRALADGLRAQGTPDVVVAALGERLLVAPQAPARLAVFATGDDSVRYEHRLAPSEQVDVVGYAAPPAIIPLLADEQDRPAYLLVVTDRAGADLSGSRGGDAPVRTWSVAGTDDEIERNAPGGWSQPRYQRRAEDSWKHNAKQVAEEVAARVAELSAEVLAISGDVRAVQFLTDALPSHPDLLISHLTGSRALDGSQTSRAEAVADMLREAATVQTRGLLDQFRAHLDPGGLAVEGRAATVGALASARVATLLVTDAPDDAAQAWFGAGPTDVYPDRDAAATSMGPVRAGRLIDVAVRSAVLTDARVRVVSASVPCLPAEGIGAICRYVTR
jgi:hypothetical protein